MVISGAGSPAQEEPAGVALSLELRRPEAGSELRKGAVPALPHLLPRVMATTYGQPAHWHQKKKERSVMNKRKTHEMWLCNQCQLMCLCTDKCTTAALPAAPLPGSMLQENLNCFCHCFSQEPLKTFKILNAIGRCRGTPDCTPQLPMGSCLMVAWPSLGGIYIMQMIYTRQHTPNTFIAGVQFFTLVLSSITWQEPYPTHADVQAQTGKVKL